MNATKPLLFLALLVRFRSLAQNSLSHVHAFHISTLPHEGILLYKDWKFHSGDSPGYAKPGFDNSYDIVKAHGGELKEETKEYQGSEFVIQLQLI